MGSTVNGTEVYDSATGEIHDVCQLGELVVHGEGGILAGVALFNHVGPLNKQFERYSTWTVQIRSAQRQLIRRERRVVIGTFLPMMFGFTSSRRAAGGRSRSRAANRVFHCMDLEDMIGMRAVDLSHCIDLTESIVSLCEARGVKFTAGRGSLAARLLKASPEWNHGRRAAPEFVNHLARTKLPGNYYGLGASPHKNYKGALYIDQTSAHHAVASTIDIPHPDHIRARGNHRTLDTGTIRRWCALSDVEGVGLLAAVINVQHIPDARKYLFPPFMHEPGRRLEYIYTNETHHLDGRHGVVEYVVASWTGTVLDTAIKEYGQWALAHRGGGPGRKPLLLAAYGALALRTDRSTTTYYARHPRGLDTELPNAGRFAEVVRERRDGQPQPTVVNVLARGLIEAETRARSLAMAQQLEADGIKVLSVYVDGIIAETDRLPFLPEGWEVERALTNVSFQNPTSFVADELRKQPGIPRATDSVSQNLMRQSAHSQAGIATLEAVGRWERRQKALQRAM